MKKVIIRNNKIYFPYRLVTLNRISNATNSSRKRINIAPNIEKIELNPNDINIVLNRSNVINFEKNEKRKSVHIKILVNNTTSNKITPFN
jgi:hypothetical protein